MNYTLKDIEFPIMLINVQKYMLRLHNAMKGMKYPQAEKCRLNYWTRLLQKIRENGYYPMWDDFQNFLQILTPYQPKISPDEYETIIAGIESEKQIQPLQGTDLRAKLLEVAFKDYLKQSFSGVKYLPLESAKYRIEAFWNSVAFIHAFAFIPFSLHNYQNFVHRFELQEYLSINDQQIIEADNHARSFTSKLKTTR